MKSGDGLELRMDKEASSASPTALFKENLDFDFSWSLDTSPTIPFSTPRRNF